MDTGTEDGEDGGTVEGRVVRASDVLASVSIGAALAAAFGAGGRAAERSADGRSASAIRLKS